MNAWPYPNWIAHRGAGKLAPENTLAAFRLGAQHGYRMFECDVKLSADGLPFLLHDATLDRTTNGRGPANTQNWNDLAALDAGSWHSPDFAGESLPSLQTLAEFCLSQGLLLNIEIKPSPGQESQTGTVVANTAACLWQNADVPPLLSSFSPDALAAAKAAQPQLPRGLLLDSLRPGWLDCAIALGCQTVICNHKLWTPRTVSQVHDAGMRALSYTVNDEASAQKLIEMGTDGIITDAVDQFQPDRAGESQTFQARRKTN
jgi:glycerophosphoryl diester phosphodiesterase